MKALVIYDSNYGNTQKIAQAIGETIGGQVLHVDEVDPADLTGCDVLVVGSPTHGGFPAEGIHGLLKAAPKLTSTHVAAFDTRTKRTIFGYAAPKVARSLRKTGGKVLASPEGFFVLGMEGPLKDGELSRATKWAQTLVDLYRESHHV